MSEMPPPPPGQDANIEPIATAIIRDTATPATAIIPNPNLKLPPIVERLGSQLEFDPLGNPYFKYPPFLLPPNGTTFVPFVLFKPAGIQVSLDPDEAEVDGEGIETVQLSAKHVAPGEKEKKKKRKKTKRELDGAPGPNDIMKVSKWWEDWMEGEDMRKADNYDPNIPRTERFAQGAADFQQGRKWTPPLQSVYDHFRHFAGLKSNKRAHFGKKSAKNDNAVEEVDEDEEDDEEDLMLTAEKEKRQEEDAMVATNAIPEIDDGGDAVMRNYFDEIDAEIEAREMRMDVFLNDPELRLKIFFSSFYKDKGLFWSVPKLRDGPILLRFFLQFFIRNRLMRDYDRAFNKALLLVDLARVELPLTTKISTQIPDPFSQACVALWGSKTPSVWDSAASVEWPSATITEDKNENMKVWEAELERQGAEKIDISTIPPPPPAEPDPTPQPRVQQAPVWGNMTPQNGTTTTDRADPPILEDDDDDDPNSPKWGSIAASSMPDPWTTPSGPAVWDLSPAPPAFLMTILGPTPLPLTHQVTLVEKSTRRILSFTPPDHTAHGLKRILGTMVMAPWVDQSPEGVSSILPAKLVMEEKGGKKGFDPAKDVIKVYVAGATMAVMKEGLGLHAIWVRVGEVGEEEGGEDGGEDGGEEEKAEKKGKKEKDGSGGPKREGEKKEGEKKEGEKKDGGAAKKRRKGKGKGKSGNAGGAGGATDGGGGVDEDKEWWYLDFLYEVMPSFWTDAALDAVAGVE